MLAITFTEKAAAELKRRVRARFLELGEREHAREAERAWVSTIHGFCARLLRANALAAGIDPDFRVLDESRAARLAIDAFDRSLEEFVRSGGERLDLAASYTPDKLEGMVRTVYSRLRSQGQTVPRLPAIEPPVAGGERERLERALRAAGAALEGVDVNKTVSAALDAMAGCRDALEALPADALGEPRAFEELRVKRGNAKALRDPLFDELGEAMDAWVGLCTASQAYGRYVLLAKLIERYDRRYTKAKADGSALDFEDLELARARPAAGRRRAARPLRARASTHVMVDEFQDTNPLQNELLDLIADDNLFTVGDELQSIYGFRNADVGVFRRRRDDAEARGARVPSRHELPRAARGARRGRTAAFGSLWDDYPPLAAGRAEREPASRASRASSCSWPTRVAAHWADALPDERVRRLDAGPQGDPRGAPRRRACSRSGSRRWRGRGGLRLRRRRGAAARRERHGRATSARSPIAASPPISRGRRRLLAPAADRRPARLPRRAREPARRAARSTRCSPRRSCGASLDALALDADAGAREGRLADAWRVLEEAFLGGDGADGLAAALAERDRERIERFVARFAAEREAAPRMSLETLIDRAVTASGYDLAILALPEGERRMANVRKLMRLARAVRGRRVRARPARLHRLRRRAGAAAARARARRRSRARGSAPCG